MDIAICQGVESLKIFHTVNLKPDIRVGVNRVASSTTDVDDRVVVFFYPKRVIVTGVNIIFSTINAGQYAPALRTPAYST